MGRFTQLPTVTRDSHPLRVLNRQLANSRIAYRAQLELTYRCNFDCVHCYVVEHQPKGELSTEEWLDVLEQLAELGTLELGLTGGEALTHPGFAEIYRRAKRLGFIVTVFSNGALINDAIVQLFRDLPPKRVEVTLYGATDATHDAVVQRRGLRQRVLDNVDRLQSAGVHVVLKSMGITQIEPELDAIREIVRERGVEEEFRFDVQITPRVDCRRGPLEHRVEIERALAQDRATPTRPDELRRLYERGLDQRVRPRRVFRCGAGNSSLVVGPKGQVTTCMLYRKEGGDVRQQSLREIWEETIPRIVAQPASRMTRCTVCEKSSLCGSCAGNGALEHDDPETPSDFACELAHARVAEFCADLVPPVPEPAGGFLPLHRKQDCRRPWLAVRRPVPAWVRDHVPRPPRRFLPLAT